VDVSLAHAALAWLTHTVAAEREPRPGRSRLHGGAACYGVYRCADGFVSLAALEPRFWQAWCEGVRRPDLVEHAWAGPGSPERAEVEAVLRARTRDEWAAFAAEVDCCLEPVLQPEEALASELVRARGMLLGERLLGSPLRLSRTPPQELRRPAPLLGEHGDELLQEPRGNT
jgi:crotonobetainyl-CoA:carnitine CoA-transferase CaiB-like acyl-CoA transferase